MASRWFHRLHSPHHCQDHESCGQSKIMGGEEKIHNVHVLEIPGEIDLMISYIYPELPG